MNAPTTEDLVEQIREVFDQAQAAGQPLPGRPTLAKLTGATDYRVRVALELLTKTSAEADQDAGGHAGADTEPDLANAEPPGEVAASARADDHQPPASHTVLAEELAAGQSPATPARPVANQEAAKEAGAVPIGGRDATSSPAPVTAAVVPTGAKVVSWAGFVFGSVMSVAANVLHTWLPAARMPPGWAPGIAAQIGAAVWPIGLLLSVEVLSRVPWRQGWGWALARFGGTGTVALGSAVISYGHVQDLLAAWDYGVLASHVGPLVLDGLMVISGFALLAMSRTAPADTEVDLSR